MEELNQELRDAQDKYLTGMMFGAAALAACVIPGAPAFLAGTKAIMGAFDALGKLASGGNGSYSDLLDGVKVGVLDTGALKRAGIDADSADGKAALGGLQSFLGMLDAQNDYQASVERIGMEKTLEGDKFKNFWFGQTISFNYNDYRSDTPQIQFMPAFYGDYGQMYGQAQWEAQGLQFFVPQGTNLYGGFGSGSALEYWAQTKNGGTLDETAMLERVRGMTDTEKLVWFGHDLEAYKQWGIELPSANVTLITCDADEFSKVTYYADQALKEGGAVGTQWDMHAAFNDKSGIHIRS